MANKNFLDASEVPRPTGDAATDGKRTYGFLCNLVGQLGYQVELLTQQNDTLTQRNDALAKQLAELKKGKEK